MPFGWGAEGEPLPDLGLNIRQERVEGVYSLLVTARDVVLGESSEA